MPKTSCERCEQALDGDEAVCPECGALVAPLQQAERGREQAGCPNCIGGVAESLCASCSGRGCRNCDGGYNLDPCQECGGTGKVGPDNSRTAGQATIDGADRQAWNQSQAAQSDLQDVFRRNEQAVQAREAERRAEASARAAEERVARERLENIVRNLSYPLAIVINVLYMSLSRAKIIAGNALLFDPISRWIFLVTGPVVRSSESDGCLGNLFALLLLVVLYVLHVSICLLSWIPIALILQAAVRKRK